MKRYRFSLEPVLRARRAQEESARQRLAGANRCLLAAAQRLDDEAQRYGQRSQGLGAYDLVQFRSDRLDAEHAAARLAAARSACDTAGAAAAEAREAWSQAARRVAALERLEVRRHQEWLTEARRREDAEADDIATSRAGVVAGR